MSSDPGLQRFQVWRHRTNSGVWNGLLLFTHGREGELPLSRADRNGPLAGHLQLLPGDQGQLALHHRKLRQADPKSRERGQGSDEVDSRRTQWCRPPFVVRRRPRVSRVYDCAMSYNARSSFKFLILALYIYLLRKFNQSSLRCKVLVTYICTVIIIIIINVFILPTVYSWKVKREKSCNTA